MHEYADLLSIVAVHAQSRSHASLLFTGLAKGSNSKQVAACQANLLKVASHLNSQQEACSALNHTPAEAFNSPATDHASLPKDGSSDTANGSAGLANGGEAVADDSLYGKKLMESDAVRKAQTQQLYAAAAAAVSEAQARHQLEQKIMKDSFTMTSQGMGAEQSRPQSKSQPLSQPCQRPLAGVQIPASKAEAKAPSREGSDGDEGDSPAGFAAALGVLWAPWHVAHDTDNDKWFLKKGVTKGDLAFPQDKGQPRWSSSHCILCKVCV